MSFDDRDPLEAQTRRAREGSPFVAKPPSSRGETVRVNVHESGSGGDGYFRRGWRAQERTGPWAQLINLPVQDGRQNIIVVVGWRPLFSLTLDVTRRAKP